MSIAAHRTEMTVRIHAALACAFILMLIAPISSNGAELPKGATEQQQAQTGNEIAQAANTISSAIQNTVQPLHDDGGCDKNKDDRNSDLCAQWKAADAARDAANWSARAFWVGLVGTGLLIWTLVANVKSSQAAIAAVEAQVSANRPLMTLGGLEVSAKSLDEAKSSRLLTVKWWVVNNGATGCWTENVVLDFSGITPPENILTKNPDHITPTVAFVPAGKGIGSGPIENMQFSKEEFDPILENRRLFVHGWIVYRDAGARRWRTGFAGWVDLTDSLSGQGFAFWPSTTHWFDERVHLPRRWRLPKLGAFAT